MNKKQLLATTAITALSVAKFGAIASADSSNFAGPYVSLGATYNEQDVDIKNNASNIPSADAAATVNDSSASVAANFVGFETSATTIMGRALNSVTKGTDEISGEITLGYNHPVNDKFLLGLDVTANSGGHDSKYTSNYSIATVAAGSAAASQSIAVSAGNIQTTTYKEDETISLGIRPSFVVNDSTMVYGRLGYGQTKATLKTSYDDATTNSTASKSVTDDLDTYQAGIGVVKNFENNFFVDVSLNYQKSERLENKRDDAAQTAALGSTGFTSATDTLKTTAEAESYGAAIKVGVRF